MKGKSFLAVSIVCLFVPRLLALGEPAGAAAGREGEGADQAADERAQRLAQFIRAVEAADHPREAIAAYGRGCAVDRTRPEIHDAYLRRMLRFGLPQIAYYPAQVLVRMQTDNGTAWGVLGYMHGRRGELDKALTTTLQAAQHAPDDPSILHNTGQLVAWYDHQPDVPKLPDPTRRALDRMRADLSRQEPFAEAYRAVGSAYKDQAALAKQFDQKIAAADAEALRLERLALDIDGQIRDLDDEIEYRQDLIDSLRRDLHDSGWAYYVDPYGRIVLYPQHGADRGEIRTRIRRQERIIEELRLKIRVLRREGMSILRDLERKRSELGRLRAQMKQALARVELRFRWDPPAVDGVVTDELDHFPPAPREAQPVPETPESAAGKRLDMARLYLTHDLREKAIEILREIIAEYGSTEAAKQAKEILREATATAERPGP